MKSKGRGSAQAGAVLDKAARVRLTGRPPYGYRMSSAARGVLEPDEQAGCVVRRIFREYLAGTGLQRIADGLNADLIPSPLSYVRDEARSAVWSKGAVRGILVNPRYAGRFSTEANPVPAAGPEPLVAAEDFDLVHGMFAARQVQRADVNLGRYVLRGLVRCAECNRLMQGTWNNDEPYLRCRLAGNHMILPGSVHPRNVYVREQRLVRAIEWWLGSACSPVRLMRDIRETGGATPSSAVLGTAGRRLRLLRNATDSDRLQIYRSLGLRLTYSGRQHALQLKAVLGPGRVISGMVAL